MNGRRIFGALLLFGGVIAFVYGMSERNSATYQLASAFGGDTSRLDLFVVGAVVIAIVGLILLVKPSPEKRSLESLSRVEIDEETAQEQQSYNKAIRAFSKTELTEIINNSVMYAPALVEECKQEFEIRNASEKLMPMVETFDDGKLRELLRNPSMYNQEMIYCCELEFNRRVNKYNEERDKQEELARIQRDKERAEQMIKDKEASKVTTKRVIKIMIVVVPLLIIIGIIVYFSSAGYRYGSGSKLINESNYEKGINRLSKIGESSRLYASAQFYIYKAYLMQNESEKAAMALRKSVINNNWEHDEAYTAYTNHLMEGDLTPFIVKNKIMAADCYKNSPNRVLDAGVIYFNALKYNEAYDIFSTLSHSEIANGYIGIMYLYGLGEVEHNLEEAWRLIRKAPDKQPFLCHKGDLTLYFDLVDRSYNMLTIRSGKFSDAKNYYELASIEEPNNKAIKLRLNVLRKLISSTEKTREPFSGGGWDTYNFSTNNDSSKGVYSGEINIGDNWTKSAHGWGCFAWGDRSFQLGKYSMLKLNGDGLKIETLRYEGTNTYCYRILTGTFSKNELINGVITNERGVEVYIGE